MSQKLEHFPKSQTLLSLLNSSSDSSSTFSSGISKLDSTLEGSNGFKKGCLYDINCVPGIVGLWPLLFKIILNCFEAGTGAGAGTKKKVLIIQNLNKIPWFQFKNNKKFKVEYKSLIDILKVKTLVQLIIILQELNFSNYEMVIIDGFHELYQLAQTNIKIVRNGGDLLSYTSDGARRSSNRNPLKRDIMGQPVINPAKKLGMILQEIMVLLGSIATTNNLLFITTGKMEPHTQKIPEESLEPLIDDDNKDRYFIQRILVPVISLTEPSSNYFTNRIILFKDWLINKPTDGVISGIDKSLNINDYIKLIESKNIKTSPHFICTSNHSGSVHFSSGWFQINNETCDIIDSENIMEIEQNMKLSTEQEGPILNVQKNTSNQDLSSPLSETIHSETNKKDNDSTHIIKKPKFSTFSIDVIPESQT